MHLLVVNKTIGVSSVGTCQLFFFFHCYLEANLLALSSSAWVTWILSLLHSSGSQPKGEIQPFILAWLLPALSLLPGSCIWGQAFLLPGTATAMFPFCYLGDWLMSRIGNCCWTGCFNLLALCFSISHWVLSSNLEASISACSISIRLWIPLAS